MECPFCVKQVPAIGILIEDVRRGVVLDVENFYARHKNSTTRIHVALDAVTPDVDVTWLWGGVVVMWCAVEPITEDVLPAEALVFLFRPQKHARLH